MTSADKSSALRAQLATLDTAELERLVRHHNALYWDKHAPEIDDPTFDKLVEALRHKAPSSPALDELGESRPAKKASSKKASSSKKAAGFEDVVHLRPMLSLDKCYDDDTLKKWGDTFKGAVVVTPKIDGLACSLRYDPSGRLHLAGTRGDGKSGDNILANVQGIKDIPKTLTNAPATAAAAARDGLEVRGEVYMSISRFNTHYKGDKSNPRNLAAGALKTKDPAESAAYGLSFFAYDLLGSVLTSEHDKHAALKAMGFPVMPLQVVDDHARLAEVFRGFVDVCKGMDVETDGVVLKADLGSEQERLGATAHHPRYALAYKFQGESGQSVVVDIEWGTARTGTVNPVAIIEPVFLSGVTITRVSLHNPGYAKKLGIGVGARVEVVRRGGVIPHIERVLAPPTKLIEVPTEWPVNGGTTPLVADGDFLLLKEPERCTDVVVARVGHFCAVIDATGFGEKRLLQLITGGLLKTPADLYRLDVKSLAALDRMGEVSAQALVDQVNARRQLTLPVLLTSLGVDDLGPTVAETLAAQFHTLPAVRAVTKEALAQVHGIGEQTATSIVTGLARQAAVIDDLLTQVTIVEPKKVEDTGSPLFGKSVVFTGTMAKLDRKTAQKRVQEKGGKTPSSVTADLDFLVIGDEGSPLLGGSELSTKHKAAEKLIAKGAKVKIISETDFMVLLG
jgi:DNA ligase (NAD+)